MTILFFITSAAILGISVYTMRIACDLIKDTHFHYLPCADSSILKKYGEYVAAMIIMIIGTIMMIIGSSYLIFSIHTSIFS